MFQLDCPLPCVQGAQEAVVPVRANSSVSAFEIQVADGNLHLFRNASFGHTDTLMGMTMNFKFVLFGLIDHLDEGRFAVKGCSVRRYH